MTGIGIIAMLSQLRGSYALAGAVSASFVLTFALVSPQISRLVDQYGQRRVLPLATAVSVIGFLGLISAAWWSAHDATLFLSAILAGFMPSMSAMVRARWTGLYQGQPQLQTAYSLETVLNEVSFIVGPPLAVGLSVGFRAGSGLLTAALLLILGVGALVLKRQTEPRADQSCMASGGRPGSVIRHPDIQRLALLMLAMGVMVGTVDMVSVAFAEAMGEPAAAGAVLSAYALGSCAAGLVFGARQTGMPPHRLLLLGGLATAATTVPLLFVSSIAALAGAVLLAGACFAPTMIVAMSLVERLLPAQRLTEGMTWLLAGLNVGVALGAGAAVVVLALSGARRGA